MEYLIEPVSMPRMTQSDRWKKRKSVLKYFAFRDEVRAHSVIMPVPCKIIFNVRMPKSWSEKKKASLRGRPHRQTPDLDNLVKGLLDAVFEDDKIVWGFAAEKRWCDYGSIIIKEIKCLKCFP